MSSRYLNIFYASVALLALAFCLLFSYSMRLMVTAGNSNRNAAAGKGWTRGKQSIAHETVWVDGDSGGGGLRLAQQQQQRVDASSNAVQHPQLNSQSVGSPVVYAAGGAATARPVRLPPDGHVVDMKFVSVVVVVRSSVFPLRTLSRLAATRLERAEFIVVAIDALKEDDFHAAVAAAAEGGVAFVGGAHRAGATKPVLGRAPRPHGATNAHALPTAHVEHDVADLLGDLEHSFAAVSARDLHPALARTRLIRVSKNAETGLYPTYAALAMMGSDLSDPESGLVYYTDGLHPPSEPYFLDHMVDDFSAERAAALASPPAMLPALLQCTVATQADRMDQFRDGPLLTLDQGFDVQLGSVRSQPAVYFSRRYAGFGLHDSRLNRRSRVTAVGPFCTLADRMATYRSGGLTSSTPSGFDLAVSGKLDARLVEDALELLRARIMRLEKTMESISLAEVHSAGNVLRQLVREAYAEVVDASSLWEELTGKTFDNEITHKLSPLAADADERARRAMVRQSIDARLKYHTKQLVDEASTARKLGHSRDASQSEDTIGWDLSMRLRAAGFAVFASNATTIYSTDELSDDLKASTVATAPRVSGAGPSSGQTQGSIALVGEFQQRWGAFARALHPAFALSSAAEPVLRVVWFAICCGCCGFSSEIVHFVVPLQQRHYVSLMPGPKCFCSGYPSAIADSIGRMHISGEQYILQRSTRDEVLVWISHTDPNGYASDIFTRRKPDYIVGRSMYEFSRVGENWIEASRLVDEIWVPARWVRDVFVRSGIRKSKVVVVPEGIDTDFYSPTAHKAIDLPLSKDDLRRWIHFCNRPPEPDAIKFFSNFKWEPRKGWDYLFEAYELMFGRSERAQEFQKTKKPLTSDATADEANATEQPRRRPVSLYILSYLFLVGPGNIHNISAVVHDLEELVRQRFPDLNGDVRQLPPFCIITDTVSEVELAQLYQSMDAFVLPTRGEGWGLPAIQAMSMAKPVIGTAWGGQDEFMTPETTFRVELDGLEEVPLNSVYGYQSGKKWATPSVTSLALLMQYVLMHPRHAAAVGRRAREHVVRHFSEEAVADVVDARLAIIKKTVLERRKKAAAHPPPLHENAHT